MMKDIAIKRTGEFLLFDPGCSSTEGGVISSV